MGQIILDDVRTIKQYNEKAEFRYIVIDHMVSNGYSSWFWDGKAEVGGWADDDGGFLQVRSAYTSGPVRAWLAVTDPEQVSKTKEKIQTLRSKDDSLAAKDPYAFLPGLESRIIFNERIFILDSLKMAGFNGPELRLAFIGAIETLERNSSIYAHEGRHAIDKKNGFSGDSEELEYRAKLSEIYFADRPFLAFTAILSRNIGDGTSHGEANLRVIKGLVEWMEENQQQIESFDPSRPTFPQMDKLTEGQLRTAVKNLDPLAA
jgi:hypothetical protein